MDAVNSIAEESQRAAEIVRSLKRYVKKHEPQNTLCDMNVIVQGALRIISGEAREHGVEIVHDSGPNIPPISGDPIQLKQVLVNLLCNAIDALDEVSHDKLLVVETRPSARGGVEVLVADNGCGLPTLPGVDVFDAFMTTKPQGLGLGLAISRTIVEAHGGQLWAATNESGGATFHFDLPVTTA